MGVSIKTQTFETQAGKPFLQCSKQLTQSLPPPSHPHHTHIQLLTNAPWRDISSQFPLVNVSLFRMKVTRRGPGSPGRSSPSSQDAVGGNASPCHANALCFAINGYLMNN